MHGVNALAPGIGPDPEIGRVGVSPNIDEEGFRAFEWSCGETGRYEDENRFHAKESQGGNSIMLFVLEVKGVELGLVDSDRPSDFDPKRSIDRQGPLAVRPRDRRLQRRGA